MGNRYAEMKRDHEKRISDLPIFYAFNNKQFKDGMEKIGLKETDTDKIFKLHDTGGFYKKTDSKLIVGTFKACDKELCDAIEDDKTGDGFIYEMFLYELDNHEYCITYDVEETLDAIGITLDDVLESQSLLHGLKKAICEIKERNE